VTRIVPFEPKTRGPSFFHGEREGDPCSCVNGEQISAILRLID